MFFSFKGAIWGLVDATIRQHQPADGDAGNIDAIAEYLMRVHAKMPDYLRVSFAVLTVLFDVWPYPTKGRPFHRLGLAERTMQIKSWEKSRLEPHRRLIEFYKTFAIYGLYSELYAHAHKGGAHRE